LKRVYLITSSSLSHEVEPAAYIKSAYATQYATHSYICSQNIYVAAGIRPVFKQFQHSSVYTYVRHWYNNIYARLIFKACRQNHIQPLLCRLHWLWMPERVSFCLAVLVYRCLHGSAPGYLASDLQHVSHLNARRRLRSSTTSALVVPRTVHSTIGDRTFPATAASVWNSLPESVRSSPSLQVFRSRLKKT